MPRAHPLVVTMHDLTPLIVPGIMPSAAKRAAYRWWNRRAVRVADRIITDAAFTVGEIERVFPSAAGRITAIPLGVDDFAAGPVGSAPGTARAHSPRSPTCSRWARPAATRTCRRCCPPSRPSPPARPELRLLLVGAEEPGYLERVLAERAPAVRERVAFTGRVDDGALRALMAGAAAFAFPSRYEGFGLPPLEAMALGTPTVVADAASLPEVVGDGALRFAPGDAAALATAIESLLDDADLRRARERRRDWRERASSRGRVRRPLRSTCTARRPPT